MGEADSSVTKQINRRVRSKSTGEASRGSDTTNTETNGAGREEAGGREEAVGGSGVPQVVSIDVPGVGTVQPTRTRKKKPKPKQQESGFSQKDLNGFIMGISTFVASRPGFEIWALSEKEINQISRPLFNIINKSGVLSKFAESADGIALGFACLTIFAPRLIITLPQIKSRVSEKNGKAKIKKQANQGTEVAGVNNGADREVTADSGSNGNGLYAELSPLN